MSQVYPPIYPWSAFESRRFLGRHHLPITPELEGQGRVQVHAACAAMRRRLMSEYERVAFERVGLLSGEYLVSEDGLFLYDRTGACISVNFPNEAAAVARMPYEQINAPEGWTLREQLFERWDALPLVEIAAVFSHIYHTNYYHFSFEAAAKFRLLEGLGVTTVLMPEALVSRPFQRDLVSRALGERVVIPLGPALRVKDPAIVQTYQSAQGLHWLRSLFEPPAPPAGRRIYVRRSPARSRRGNNIAETPDFLRVMAAHGFEAVDFGDGETPIQEQIRMLAGASVVLSVHGAGLTNLAYLQPPLRVIEVFSRAVLSTSFMRISAALGFDHHAVIAEALDAAGDIVVDAAILEPLLSRA